MTPVSFESAPGGARHGQVRVSMLRAGLVVALTTALTQAPVRAQTGAALGGGTSLRTIHTRALTAVLAGRGIALTRRAEVSAPLQRRLSKEVPAGDRPLAGVVLVTDGRWIPMEGADATVGDLLTRQGITVRSSDAVMPEPSTPLMGGMFIYVVRVGHHLVTVQQEIPYHVRTVRDPTVPRGVQRVLQLGRTGVRDRVFRVTVADGVMVGKVLVGERLRRAPVDLVTRVGTRARIAAGGPFAGREYLDMVATAYSPFCCMGVHNITSAGLKAGYGVVAVDPTIIPLGSQLYIEGYGYAIAGDVGGHIKGSRIDLGFATKREALRYGVHRVRVYVILGR